jgi:acyl carrier protein
MSIQYPNIKEKIFTYVQLITHTDVHSLTPQTLLFKEGIMDSMAFFLLIDHIEEHFGITLGDKDLVEENFESVDSISAYILRKKALQVLPSV